MWQHLPKDIRLQIARDLSIDVYIALGVSPGKLQVPVYLSEALINAKCRLRVALCSSAVWFYRYDSKGRLHTYLLKYSQNSTYDFTYHSWVSGGDLIYAWASQDNTVYKRIYKWDLR